MLYLRNETMLLIATMLWTVVSAESVVDTPQILRYNNVNDGLGSYSFDFETSDGITRQEMGSFVNDPSLNKPVLRVYGSYTYTGPDGVTYTVFYTADENGYRPAVPKMPSFGSDSSFGGLSSGVVASLLG